MKRYKDSEIEELVRNLCKIEKEPEWLEFKCNNKDPKLIGEYISALSNSAAMIERTCAYIIWGVDDDTHEIVGTSFNFDLMKKGNEDISLWLSHQLSPTPLISYRYIEIDGKHVGILKIEAAKDEPIKFEGVEYIRRGENKKKLKDCPDLERVLWESFSRKSFETSVAMENVTGDEVLALLDFSSYFDLLRLSLPTNRDSILKALEEDKMIVRNDFGKYDILNLGAILFAKHLSEFDHISRKSIRVIQYAGNSRASQTIKEQVGGKGYAIGFEGLINYITGIIPSNEVIGKAFRTVVPMYPELSVREIVANAIIHQDLMMTGTSVTIEIFSDRFEVTNPGAPLIEPERFLDHPPISRNEKMAAFMRRIGVCEERGSGFDKVVFESELYQLPAPEIEVYESHTKITLLSHKEYKDMDKEDRVRSCYLHACLKRVNREAMTNTTLRERFNIDEKNRSMISRLIKETVDRGLIKLENEKAGDKSKRYLPFWA